MMTMTLSAPPLSPVRTFLFAVLALIWFGEMLFTVTHAFEAALKAALLVLALLGPLSREITVDWESTEAY